MTNADKIRNMTTSQLATWLAAMLGSNPFDGTGNDYKWWRNWLEKEVENEDKT